MELVFCYNICELLKGAKNTDEKTTVSPACVGTYERFGCVACFRG